MTYPTDEQVEAARKAFLASGNVDTLINSSRNEYVECWTGSDLDAAIRAALTAAGPVLDREVVSEAVRQAYLDGQQAGLHGCCTIDVDRWKQRTGTILASAMTREQVRREELERLADIAEDEALGIFDSYLSVADWLRSQIGDG